MFVVVSALVWGQLCPCVVLVKKRPVGSWEGVFVTVCAMWACVCVCLCSPLFEEVFEVRCGEGCDHVCMGLFLCESVCVCLCLCMCVGVCHVESVSATESARCVSVRLCGL